MIRRLAMARLTYMPVEIFADLAEDFGEDEIAQAMRNKMDFVFPYLWDNCLDFLYAEWRNQTLKMGYKRLAEEVKSNKDNNPALDYLTKTARRPQQLLIESIRYGVSVAVAVRDRQQYNELLKVARVLGRRQDEKFLKGSFTSYRFSC